MNKPTYLITGATGGIGAALLRQLANNEVRVLAVVRSEEKLLNIVETFNNSKFELIPIMLDINQPQAAAQLAEIIAHVEYPIDYLIQLAGIQSFKQLEDLEDIDIAQQIHINLTTPITITKHLLPLLKQQSSAHIINIGSTFGSIGFAHFSPYCASKFGLRGFSESLRRELRDTHISISYIAPRATATTMNSDALYQFAEQTSMPMDTPETVAKQIIKAIDRRKPMHYIGRAERFFVKINAFFPRLVDFALVKQNRIAKQILNT